MKKALVTGANGFIGHALVQKLLEHGVQVFALAREEHRKEISNRVQFIPYELKDSKRLVELVPDRDIDVFYHLAWAGIADPGRQDPQLQLNNVNWTLDCLRAAKEMNCKKFVGAGSITEKEILEVISTQGNPQNSGYMIYGCGKITAHAMAMTLAASLQIDFCWTRITNVYGPGEISPRFINSTIRKILNKELLKFTSATQNYDFVYISDAAEAFYRIGEFGRPYYTYLIGSSHARPLKEFILELQKVLAPEQKFIFGEVPFQGINLPLECYDCSITKRDTGFCAEVSFQEGIWRTMEWLKGV